MIICFSGGGRNNEEQVHFFPQMFLEFIYKFSFCLSVCLQNPFSAPSPSTLANEDLKESLRKQRKTYF